MNGGESNIEIFRPFGEGFELMKRILFQPFDLKKWLVIGFAAWLAHLGGGGGFNYSDNRHHDAQKLNETISQIPQPILITGICILVCFVFLLIVLVAWLRARGRFIFVDCIVHNRAAIVQPWKEFRAEGNSFFLFSLIVVFGLISLAVLGTLGLALPLIIRGPGSRPDSVLLIACLRIPDFPNLSGADVGCDIAFDGPDHVSATVSCAARICSSDGFGCLSSRADPSIRVVPCGAGYRGSDDRLCGCLCDLLHRRDSVCRLGYTFAGVSDAWRVFAFVPAPVRFGLRCLGRLYTAGIFACVNAATFVFAE